MNYCEECGTIEGTFDPIITDEGIVEVCVACGAENSKRTIPEHDDNDMER